MPFVLSIVYEVISIIIHLLIGYKIGIRCTKKKGIFFSATAGILYFLFSLLSLLIWETNLTRFYTMGIIGILSCMIGAFFGARQKELNCLPVQ